MHGVVKRTSVVLVISCLLGLFYDGLQAIYRLNLVGFLDDLNSLSRHTSSIVDCLGSDQRIKMQLFMTRSCSPQSLSAHCVNVLEAAQPIHVLKKDKLSMPIGSMIIYSDPFLGEEVPDINQYKDFCDAHALRIGSVVWETTEPRPAKIAHINAYCDAIIVPDEWLVGVYKKSGVTCPIFVLPLVLNLESLLARRLKKKRPEKKFIFGFSGFFLDNGRKNHELLLHAFIKEFGLHERVMLKVHGRGAETNLFTHVLQPFASKLEQTNIMLEKKAFVRHEYEAYLASLDCYVTIAKGEGFSIIPREVLALGIPCIISNNSAQQTICNTGYVRPVASNILEESPNGGYWCNAHLNDVREALRDVYLNYDYYVMQAQKGREWVKQYLLKNIASKYQSLVWPKTIILGDRNELTDAYLMTDSPVLFEKYEKLFRPAKIKSIVSLNDKQ